MVGIFERKTTEDLKIYLVGRVELHDGGVLVGRAEAGDALRAVRVKRPHGGPVLAANGWQKVGKGGRLPSSRQASIR